VKKFIAAIALMLVAIAGLEAAPTLGVSWRAPANAKIPGVRILSVNYGSNAEELGLEVGDTVLAINGKLVRTGAEATKAVVDAKGKLTLLVMERKGGMIEIKAEIDEPTNGLVLDPNAKPKYKNIMRTRK
jgi:S1-C subfamily serine protease